jgi:DNA mismatch repair protein MutL
MADCLLLIAEKMHRIRELPSFVVTKIAAGEVIERPASVVKELIENSLDAGATRIEVDLEQGGADLIRVVDDGCGIDPDDLPLAFVTHATSKLADVDDLFRVGTLGFRGEALASIGGVAHVTLQSRSPERESGGEIHNRDGAFTPVLPWNGSPGTRIEVRNLFHNVPVRRKFLKMTATELNHVVEAVTRLALAHPLVDFVVRHHGKSVIEVPGTAGLFDRLHLFFGREVADRLYQIDQSAGPARLTGYVADPSCERGNAKLQYLFVNGRWIRDRSLGHAVQEGYRGLIMTGRYPVWFLSLQLPPDLIDVNVHPTKAEVRFRDAQAVFHLVLTAVRDRLQTLNLVPKLVAPPEDPQSVFRPRLPESDPAWFAPAPSNSTPTIFDAAPAATRALSTSDDSGREPHASQWNLSTKAVQMHDAYLLVETADGVLVIDQHALHERILFEQLRRRMQTGPVERQRLLVPEPIDLTPEQSASVLEQKGALAELGLDVEEFGGGTILLTSFPALLTRATPGAIFRSVVDRLMAKSRAPSREALLNDLLASMACRAAVKAGDRLSPEEIGELIAQRELADNTHHCPHGRPTSLLFSRQELDRQFRRT